MTGKIHHLKQELAALEAKTTEFVETFRNLYQTYLDTLSQSVSKQLILASYQLCTHKYPQEFIQLTYSQRQKLQEEVKKIGKNANNKLLELLTRKPQQVKRETINILEEMLMGIESTQDLNNSPKEEVEEDLNDFKKPDVLLDWIQQIDKGIIQVLDELSMELNEQLQKFKILPPQLPKQVINLAIQAEVPEHTSSGNPNLLDVLIETENKTSESEKTEEETTNSQITKLIAIHLRLTEIEFADPNLTLQRKQIRHLLDQTIQLKKQYYKKQKECAIAEAESAWRASWYD
ncbi:hypothetical protein [Chroococcus sp. FPU101]|uniref:hypothetical protein n=1 Tax=Chroococcus sp. FPU101 TaxID=1974212 RepID=UPI001A8E2722|nr:hypothetical protein [Chroococcus sp. FPU101]GFE67753.1 hypothetical protein CFPU101_03630 [Chroococcus sp. FPU101]